MKARLIQAWTTLRESYWFLPAVLSVVAIALAVVATLVDRRFGPWDQWWLPAIRPEGARALLSVAAGSLITVAGVAISVTLVALASMSAQFGPRLLVLFLRDRGIQLALALFTASFLCCLVVLLFVRSPGDPGTTAREAFVPQVALALAFIAALVSVGTFIYLVHHVAQMLQVGNVVARAGQELVAGIAAQEAGRRRGTTVAPEDVHEQGPPLRDAVVLRADRDGYLQVLDVDALQDAATKQDRVVAIELRVGEFVTEGVVIARLWPDTPLDAESEQDFRDAFAWGSRRTAEQDIQFEADQLVQIAARALSPGVNDPFTAMSCIDWLEAAVRRFGYLAPGAWLRIEHEGEVRCFRPVTSQEQFLDAAFGQLIPHAASDLAAARHLAAALARQATLTDDREQQRQLERVGTRLRNAAAVHLADPADVALVSSDLDWIGT